MDLLQGSFGPFGPKVSQRKRDDNKNKICAFQGGWAGGQRGKLAKTLLFMGNVMTIRFRKWKFYCREILLSWRRLLVRRESRTEFSGPLGPRTPKVENGVEKESKSIVFQLLWLFFDSVFDFLGPGAERPRELIFGLSFQLWARRAQMTPVAGKSFRNQLQSSLVEVIMSSHSPQTYTNTSEFVSELVLPKLITPTLFKLVRILM